MKHSRIFRHFAILAVAITSIVALSSFTTAAMVDDNSGKEVLNMIVKETKAGLPENLGGGLVMSDIYI